MDPECWIGWEGNVGLIILRSIFTYLVVVELLATFLEANQGGQHENVAINISIYR